MEMEINYEIFDCHQQRYRPVTGGTLIREEKYIMYLATTPENQLFIIKLFSYETGAELEKFYRVLEARLKHYAPFLADLILLQKPFMGYVIPCDKRQNFMDGIGNETSQSEKLRNLIEIAELMQEFHAKGGTFCGIPKEAFIRTEQGMKLCAPEAIYRCYAGYGWISSTGTNAYTDSPFTEDGRYFPVMNDLVNAIPEVVKEKHFGAQMHSDYIGSLTGRISNLLTGSKGSMLNCRKSIDFLKLLDSHVILELDDLRSGNDKAFVMGLILARLSESLKIRHAAQNDFRHITLVEEAHRLLSREDHSSARKAAVESFTDLLAEVRKYGECLIIADQIPNKLAPDVLKNTNTKIIHQLFAADDKDAIGDAMMLEQNQREYLSSLLAGEVIVFTATTPKPVNLKILSHTDTSQEVSEEEINALFARMRRRYDKLIADGCIFGTMSAEQRNRLDCQAAISERLIDILERKIPLFEKEREKALEKMKLFCNLLEQAAEQVQMSAQEVWNEIAWRYLISSGIIRKRFSDLKEVFSAISGLYGKISDYVSTQEYFPKEELETFRKNYELN